MNINDIINGLISVPSARLLNAIEILQEEDAYDTYWESDGTLITDWHTSFITKLNDSLVSNRVASFSNKERAVFDAYVSPTVFTVDDLTDQAVLNLDTYLGAILLGSIPITV